MTESLIMKALQAKLASSGLDWIKLESFHLSSRDKTINAEVMLEGEDRPVKLEVRYALGSGNSVMIRELITNRPWMSEALKLAMLKTGNRFELPGGLKGKLLKVLL